VTPARRAQMSWAFYDWANSAFATTVLAGFFPIFFDRYWRRTWPARERLLQGWAGSIASIAVMILAPLLGGVADRRGRKKHFLSPILIFLDIEVTEDSSK